MDYEVINWAIDDIEKIVKYYGKKKQINEKVSNDLTIALLGYYLVFGPEIFEKINIVLGALEINGFENREELHNYLLNFFKNDKNLIDYATSALYWDYHYANNKFIGAIPEIYYICGGPIILAHELSHALEGLGCTYSEDDDYLIIKGIGETTFIKQENIPKDMPKNIGFIELLTSVIENRIAKSLFQLDIEQINNEMIKEYLKSIQEFKGKDIITEGYSPMLAVYRDFCENEVFFDLIKKYHYNQDLEGMSSDYNLIAEGLDFNILMTVANFIYEKNFDSLAILKANEAIAKQAKIFNEATGYKPDKRILVLV